MPEIIPQVQKTIKIRVFPVMICHCHLWSHYLQELVNVDFLHVTKAKEGGIFTLLDGIIRRSRNLHSSTQSHHSAIVGEWSATIIGMEGEGGKGREEDGCFLLRMCEPTTAKPAL